MSEHIGSLYIENEIKLSWSIQQGIVYNKDKTEQRNDLFNRCDLHRNRNITIMIDWIGRLYIDDMIVL